MRQPALGFVWRSQGLLDAIWPNLAGAAFPPQDARHEYKDMQTDEHDFDADIANTASEKFEGKEPEEQPLALTHRRESGDEDGPGAWNGASPAAQRVAALAGAVPEASERGDNKAFLARR